LHIVNCPKLCSNSVESCLSVPFPVYKKQFLVFHLLGVDMSILLVTLLQTYEVEATPWLVLTRQWGIHTFFFGN
jgi:hypothetical protein